jgi:tRNA uridine 5-carboxymethylaminomethyl modification enzyme
LMAGINAHLKVHEKSLWFWEEMKHIGVLIDDEYREIRMFTSRAEYRTLLRQIMPISDWPGAWNRFIWIARRMEHKLKESNNMVSFSERLVLALAEANY